MTAPACYQGCGEGQTFLVQEGSGSHPNFTLLLFLSFVYLF